MIEFLARRGVAGALFEHRWHINALIVPTVVLVVVVAVDLFRPVRPAPPGGIGAGTGIVTDR